MAAEEHALLVDRHESEARSRSVDARLRNIRFRPIRPDDWRRLQRFHQRLSPETVEYRFHGAKRQLSEPLAHRFTEMNGRDAVAIVATTGTRGRIVGVARYYRIDDARAEVAFVVEDDYQHHRIGGRLMRRLRDVARANGITTFVAEVLPSNAPMVRLLHEVGPTETRFSNGVWEVTTMLDEER